MAKKKKKILPNEEEIEYLFEIQNDDGVTLYVTGRYANGDIMGQTVSGENVWNPFHLDEETLIDYGYHLDTDAGYQAWKESGYKVEPTEEDDDSDDDKDGDDGKGGDDDKGGDIDEEFIDFVQPPPATYLAPDVTYVEMKNVSDCGALFTKKAGELDTLMDNLNLEFEKTINSAWIDENSEKLKVMFKDFIEESKIINSEVKEYGKVIANAAFDYSEEQKNSITKMGDDYYGK